jgi:hypothetical protein
MSKIKNVKNLQKVEKVLKIKHIRDSIERNLLKGGNHFD